MKQEEVEQEELKQSVKYKPIAVGDMQRKLDCFESWKEATNDDSTNVVTNGDAEPLPILLTDEDKEIVITIESIIAPKSKTKAKTKPIIKSDSKISKAKPIDVDKPVVKRNCKSAHPKQITLLSNQTLQIKLPADYKNCKMAHPKQITLLSNQTLQIKLPEDYTICKIELIYMSIKLIIFYLYIQFNQNESQNNISGVFT